MRMRVLLALAGASAVLLAGIAGTSRPAAAAEVNCAGAISGTLLEVLAANRDCQPGSGFVAALPPSPPAVPGGGSSAGGNSTGSTIAPAPASAPTEAGAFEAWLRAHQDEFASDLTRYLRQKDVNGINLGNNRAEVRQARVVGQQGAGYLVEITYVHSTATAWLGQSGHVYSETFYILLAGDEMAEIRLAS